MEVIDILKKYEHILSFTAIENELGIPPTTISKAIRGHRDFPNKWNMVLKNYLKHLSLEISLIE